MDRKKLEALRAKYAAAAPGDVARSGVQKAIELMFAGTDRRPKPYEGVSTFLGAPLRLDAPQQPDFGRARRGARRRADGSGRHQPAGRPLRAPRGARRSSASAPTITCIGSCRWPRSRSPTSAMCRFAAATAWPTASRTSRRYFARIAAAGVAPLARRRRPLHHLSDPQGGGREAPRGAGAHRCALRHGRPLRGRQIPSWRAVPEGGAGGRPRSRAHHPDRHPRRRRVPVGVLLRQRHDRHPCRGVPAVGLCSAPSRESARWSATGRPTYPSTSTASTRPSRRAPARPKSVASARGEAMALLRGLRRARHRRRRRRRGRAAVRCHHQHGAGRGADAVRDPGPRRAGAPPAARSKKAR